LPIIGKKVIEIETGKLHGALHAPERHACQSGASRHAGPVGINFRFRYPSR
jgi:hypothetical protein